MRLRQERAGSSPAAAPSVHRCRRDQCDDRPSAPPIAFVVISNQGAPASSSRTWTRRRASSESMNSNVRPAALREQRQRCRGGDGREPPHPQRHGRQPATAARRLHGYRWLQSSFEVVPSMPRGKLGRESLKLCESRARRRPGCGVHYASDSGTSPSSRHALSENLPFPPTLETLALPLDGTGALAVSSRFKGGRNSCRIRDVLDHRRRPRRPHRVLSADQAGHLGDRHRGRSRPMSAASAAP